MGVLSTPFGSLLAGRGTGVPSRLRAGLGRTLDLELEVRYRRGVKIDRLGGFIGLMLSLIALALWLAFA